MSERKRPIVRVSEEQMAAFKRGEPITVEMAEDWWQRLKGDGPKDEFGITFPADWCAQP